MVTCDVLPSANTFEGKPALNSLIFYFTLVRTSIGFEPERATTTATTTSAPSLSNKPRLVAGPNETFQMSLIRIAE